MIEAQLRELLLQALEHELGGVLIYTALECAVNRDLKKEWSEYLEETEKHVEVLTSACESLGLDPGEVTPGRKVVHESGKGLIKLMKMTLSAEDKAAAQLVACDCVVLAETKDHANWQLIGECAKAMKGEAADALQNAYDEVEDEEDEHLYHTKGWCRELWLKSLGLKAVLPPPEEKKDVKSAKEAAKVQKERKVDKGSVLRT